MNWTYEYECFIVLTYGRVDDSERALHVLDGDSLVSDVLAAELGNDLADVLVLRQLPLSKQLASELHSVEAFFILGC